MKNWSLILILVSGLLCLSACQTQAAAPASSGSAVQDQQSQQVDDENQTAEEQAEAQEEAEEARQEALEEAREAQAEAEEAQREAQEEAQEAQREAMADLREAQEDIREAMIEARQGWQEGMIEARKGLAEAQKEMRDAGINIDLNGIVNSSLGTIFTSGRESKPQAAMVVPNKPMDKKVLSELTEDMQVMTVVLEEKLGKSKTDDDGFGPAVTGAIFVNVFGGAPQTKAAYLDGYGMMFTLDVDFPLVLIKGVEEKPQETDKDKKDEVWQRSKDKIKGKVKDKIKNKIKDKDKDKEPALVFDAEKVKQLQSDLITTLKHAANIRNLRPQEKVIIVVRSVVNGECLSQPAPGSEQNETAEPVAIPTSVMTLQAIKQDINAFAEGQLTPERFAERVSVVIY